MAEARRPPIALDAAMAFARRGWRVIPIPPGQKHPAIAAWQREGTTDTDRITHWFTKAPDHGVGIVTGAESGLFVLDVDIAGDKAGDDTLAELEATYSKLPDTLEVVTGSGGRHLYFAWPGVEIRNDAGRKLGPGLDIRGEGGQVLAPPTIHPNGQPYLFDATCTRDVNPAPAWLIGLLTQPEPTAEPRPQVQGATGDRPGDLWAAQTTWAQLLEPDGWTLHHTAPDGEQFWTRPGKDRRDGTSATVGYKGADVLKVFTSSVPALAPEQTYSKLGYYAATRHGGDHSAAARALRAEGWKAADVELEQLIGNDGAPVEEQPPVKLNIRWTDDLATNMPPEPPEFVEGLLRAGEFTVIGAPRAIGKTWLGYNLGIMLSRGEGRLFGVLPVKRQARVLYLQGELDEWGSAHRWRMLTGGDLGHLSGESALPAIAESFDRVRIQVHKMRRQTFVDGAPASEEYVDARISQELVDAITEHNIQVVVVDPWAVYLAGRENDNDEVEAALGRMREVTLATGVSWVILHHIGKALEAREPEDLWRGASRLADWASTRVTVMPHYSEAKRKELGMERREARRHVDVFFLRRSTPTDDFSMKLREDGWWEQWEDPDSDRSTDLRELEYRLRMDGGEWRSVRQAAVSLNIHYTRAKELIERARKAGLVTVEPGPRNAPIVRLHQVDRPVIVTADTQDVRAEEPAQSLTAQSSCADESVVDQGISDRLRGLREIDRADESAGQSTARTDPPYVVGGAGADGAQAPPPARPADEGHTDIFANPERFAANGRADDHHQEGA